MQVGLKDLALARPVCTFFEAYWQDKFSNNVLPLRVGLDAATVNDVMGVISAWLTVFGYVPELVTLGFAVSYYLLDIFCVSKFVKISNTEMDVSYPFLLHHFVTLSLTPIMQKTTLTWMKTFPRRCSSEMLKKTPLVL